MKNKLYFFLLFFVFFSCQETDYEGVFSNCTDNINSIEENKILVIGVDGVRSDALIAASTPNIDELKKKSAFTYSCHIDSINSSSGPNWSSILTGVWYHKHGVEANNFLPSNYDLYPDFLSRIEMIQPNLYTSASCSWEKLSTKVIANSDHNFGDQKNDGSVEDDVKKQLERCDFDVGFIHFLDVDNKGHNNGFGLQSEKYIEAIENIDKRVGDLMDIIHLREEILTENWLVIFTTDHGGITLTEFDRFPGTHDGYGDDPVVKHVPLMFYNKNFSEKNIPESVFIVDIVPTILEFLEITIDSEWELDGTPIDL